MDRGLSWDLPPQRIVLPHHTPSFHHTPNLLPREMERNLGSHSSAQLFPPSSLSLPLSTPIPAHYMPWAPFLQNASSRTPPPVCTLCYQWLLISHRLTPKFLGIAGKGNGLFCSTSHHMHRLPTIPSPHWNIPNSHCRLNPSQKLLEKSWLTCMAQLKFTSSSMKHS